MRHGHPPAWKSTSLYFALRVRCASAVSFEIRSRRVCQTQCRFASLECSNPVSLSDTKKAPPLAKPFCIWRRERDSNPRRAFYTLTPLAGERLQPLGHLSVVLSQHCVDSWSFALPMEARYSGHPALHPFGAVCAMLRRSNSLPAN